MKDDVKSAGFGLVEVTTDTGWSAVIAASEIQTVRGRPDGGSVVHLHNGNPILLDVSVRRVLAAMKGAANATKTA